MAIVVQQIQPVAHLPLVLGVLRRLDVATVIDRLIPPHSAHVLAQQQAQSHAAAQAKEAEAVVDHQRQVHARWCACLPDAEAASAQENGRGNQTP
jgi:hypothetical protein